MLTFKQLNQGWNADPNAPHPAVSRDGSDIVLRFFLNPHQFKQFKNEDIGILRFSDCVRYRLGPTNDEGWHLGQCRYSASAPAWGAFYELIGDDPLIDLPSDWEMVTASSTPSRHLLFYLRDDTFECVASGWRYDPAPLNALQQAFG
jgi:hypothetical protein